MWLGIANDVLEIMEEDFEREMDHFYKFWRHKPGNTPGGKFTGKVLRDIMSEECLADLGRLLEEPGVIFIEYLESIREAYRTCVQKKLDPDYKYEDAFARFDAAFNAVHVATQGRLTETLKASF